VEHGCALCGETNELFVDPSGGGGGAALAAGR
jgi:hypothetical protein